MKQNHQIKLESHGRAHIKEVKERAFKINKYLEDNLGIHADMEIINLAADYHDITAMTDRPNHHLSGAARFYTDNKNTYGEITTRRVVECIREHRASFKGEYSSLESQILSTADRGDINPTKISDLFRRAYTYSRENNLSHEDAVHSSFNHIKSKYGREGYAFNKHNKVFFVYYKNQLEKFWEALELIDKAFVFNLLEDTRAKEYNLQPTEEDYYR